jgi:hypothetical protein
MDATLSQLEWKSTPATQPDVGGDTAGGAVPSDSAPSKAAANLLRLLLKLLRLLLKLLRLLMHLPRLLVHLHQATKSPLVTEPAMISAARWIQAHTFHVLGL